MKINPEIRFARKGDIEHIIDLCELHAAYEKSSYSRTGKAQLLLDGLLGVNPKLFCLVVEGEKNLLAYATYMKQYATWDAMEYVYMDCLYVREAIRGQRIGEKLVSRIKEEGQKMGCAWIQWQTPTFNTRAIKFYNRIGATYKSKERFFLNINQQSVE